MMRSTAFQLGWVLGTQDAVQIWQHNTRHAIAKQITQSRTGVWWMFCPGHHISGGLLRHTIPIPFCPTVHILQLISEVYSFLLGPAYLFKSGLVRDPSQAWSSTTPSRDSTLALTFPVKLVSVPWSRS